MPYVQINSRGRAMLRVRGIRSFGAAKRGELVRRAESFARAWAAQRLLELGKPVTKFEARVVEGRRRVYLGL